MASREAIREFQEQFVRRLQEVGSQNTKVTWLAVVAGGFGYLLPLVQTAEICPLPEVQVVPYVQPWFKGVAQIQGRLYGVVSMADFFGNLRDAARIPTAQADTRNVIALNATLGVNCALQVDGLRGLRDAHTFSSWTPPILGAEPYFGNRFMDKQGHTWQELHLQALCTCPNFLNIAL